jgi:tetratricopeptide (TPR) repeat protein
MVCPRCGSNPNSEPSAKGPVRRQRQKKPRHRPKRARSKKSGTLLKGPLFIVFLITAFSYYFVYHYSPPHPEEPGVKVKETPVASPGGGEVQRPRLKPLPVKTVDTAPAARTALKPRVVTGSNEALSAFNEGDFPKAARLSRSALEDSPRDPALRRNLARSLAGMGWNEMKNNDHEKARELFSEAIELEKDPSYFNGLATAQVKLNELEAAAETLERVKDDGSAAANLVVVYNSLGDKARQSGDIDGAVSYYEKALELDPSARQISLKLEGLQREKSAEEDFKKTEGSHFLVKYEGGENAVAGYLIVLLLEEAYLKVGADLGYYPEDSMGAVLYSKKQFQDITRTPSWVGAMFDGRIKLPVGGVTERTEVLEKVLFHEYTHAVVHRLSGGRAPVWLNEGMAQYEEGKRAASNKGTLKSIVVNNRVSLRGLEGSFMGLSSEEAEAAYLMSLSVTEYIINEFGPFALKRMLERMGGGLSIDKAISSSIFIPYDVLEESWLESLKR